MSDSAQNSTLSYSDSYKNSRMIRRTKKYIDRRKDEFDLKTIQRDLTAKLKFDVKKFEAQLREFLTSSVRAGVLEMVGGKYVPRRRGENSTSRGENSTSRGENSTSRGENSTSRGENSTSRGENSISRGENSTSRGENSTSRGENSNSRGENSTSRGENSTRRRNKRTTEAKRRRRHNRRVKASEARNASRGPLPDALRDEQRHGTQ